MNTLADRTSRRTANTLAAAGAAVVVSDVVVDTRAPLTPSAFLG
jgi:hypothetical protein